MHFSALFLGHGDQCEVVPCVMPQILTIMQNAAIALHYFLIVTFLWLLVQAESLYRAITQVWDAPNRSSYFNIFLLWVVPILYVVACVTLAKDDYNHNCWIDMNSSLAIAVIFPLVLMCVINILISGMVLYELRKASNGEHFSARASLGVATLLGLAWTFGLIAFAHQSAFWEFLFIIALMLQTIVWCYNQLTSKNIRESLSSAWVRSNLVYFTYVLCCAGEFRPFRETAVRR